ncbi:hypothetical protein B0J11DRAFT_574095 [Dendryphion nanum]|uniref:Uncharacterized protein n=1 Tax=Dendryphion nanum TaxID=256645 RepID=A0A9P9EHT0_9PLEO|nr:hypothetical protein B0J11DRAFT_574095 [Dendryphion nanum]
MSYYTYARKLTNDEQTLVSDGYPYINTNILAPGGKLNPHSHHSHNTHYVISGLLSISKMNFKHVYHFEAGHEAKVTPGLTYHGVAGPEGCTFIEGHRRLSFDTAERFVARGALMRVDEGTPKSFPARRY